VKAELTAILERIRLWRCSQSDVTYEEEDDDEDNV
jgi:hypothetical protein